MPPLYPRALSNCGTLMSVPLMPDSSITTPSEGLWWRPERRSGDWTTFATQNRRPRFLRETNRNVSRNINHSMKKSIALIFAASTLFLAGCCTTPHATKWEYKVAQVPHLPVDNNTPSPQDWRERTQRFLNDLGKDGWVLVSASEGRVFYFKRPIK